MQDKPNGWPIVFYSSYLNMGSFESRGLKNMYGNEKLVVEISECCETSGKSERKDSR